MSLSIDDLLRSRGREQSSDLHLKVGNPRNLRVDALLNAISDVPARHPRRNAFHGVQHDDHRQKQKFKETAELDMAYGVAGLAASALTSFQQRATSHGLARIPTKILHRELNLPAVINRICEEAGGLVLVPATTELRQIHQPRGHDRPINANRSIT